MIFMSMNKIKFSSLSSPHIYILFVSVLVFISVKDELCFFFSLGLHFAFIFLTRPVDAGLCNQFRCDA